MKRIYFVFIGLLLICLSCKKDSHSCTDGIYSPEYEEYTDCGKTCGPCYSSNNDNLAFIFAKINGENNNFGKYSLSNNQNWILNFHKDSIYVTLNLGNSVAIGNQSIHSAASSATVGYTPYSTLISGSVGFTEIDMQNHKMSGIFDATFVSDLQDTLHVTSGEFQNISWQ